MIARIAEALTAGSTIGQACAYVGIDDSTYYQWIRHAEKRGGIYRDLRDAVKQSIAAGGMAGLKAIADVAQDNWQAAAWQVERSERILERLNAAPDRLKAHQERRQEWMPYGFSGDKRERTAKIEVLAYIEEMFTVVTACRAAGFPRYKFKRWIADDAVFRACVEEAMLVCIQTVEATMFRSAMTTDSKGQLTACFGILNAKTSDYGLLKAQLFARQNAKFVDEIGTILAELPADTRERLQQRLDQLQRRAALLPSGASLR